MAAQELSEAPGQTLEQTLDARTDELLAEFEERGCWIESREARPKYAGWLAEQEADGAQIEEEPDYELPEAPAGSLVWMDGALWEAPQRWWVRRDWRRITTLSRHLARRGRFVGPLFPPALSSGRAQSRPREQGRARTTTRRSRSPGRPRPAEDDPDPLDRMAAA